MSRPHRAPEAEEDVDRILEAVIYLYAESRRTTKELARRHGLTGPQVTAIKMLEGFGDLSLSALSTRMMAHNSTITGLADRLVSGGLVERTRSRRDRRVVRIGLTDRGRSLARAIPVTAMEIFARALRSLTPEERKQLRAILRKLTDRVQDEVGLLADERAATEG